MYGLAEAARELAANHLGVEATKNNEAYTL